MKSTGLDRFRFLCDRHLDFIARNVQHPLQWLRAMTSLYAYKHSQIQEADQMLLIPAEEVDALFHASDVPPLNLEMCRAWVCGYESSWSN